MFYFLEFAYRPIGIRNFFQIAYESLNALLHVYEKSFENSLMAPHKLQNLKYFPKLFRKNYDIVEILSKVCSH